MRQKWREKGKTQSDTKDVMFTCWTFWMLPQYKSSVLVTTLGHEGFRESWLADLKCKNMR